MPVNALTTEVGLRVGPIVLETLVKHYFDRFKRDTQDAEKSNRLRQDELLYDEVFNVVKTFLQAASFHTVEDVQALYQAFGNTRTPSPPWVHVVRVLIPMSSCDDAAVHLVKALGGEAVLRRIVGGVKWWQVRGISGVDAQWISSKKDWQEAKRRHKMQERDTNNSANGPLDANGNYDSDMDAMRCILYSHGGGYYFGSVDQERYSIQRHARKINGRVFAVNYRLAPQYPFPCALQDLLAAYLFLIRPPINAVHQAVNPLHIVVAGDSAGGGISLALLQLIRDSGLPMPAGGVLISPWCDLTHSFPSVHTNTDTDVIPSWGLSFQKPSILWPPPSYGPSIPVYTGLRSRIHRVFGTESSRGPKITPKIYQAPSPDGTPVDVEPNTTDPSSGKREDSQLISIVARSGEVLTIDRQVHMYAQNTLLSHPLISPVLSYLGGLPPLLIIASDKEVLRDEIIYAAHKAANPEKYPVTDEVRNLYPPLNGIEGRCKSTRVHLQIYDDAAHVLPVLFSFTTPAKFCFRAIAAFCKHVTGMTPSTPLHSSAFIPSLPLQTSFQGTEGPNNSNECPATDPRSLNNTCPTALTSQIQHASLRRSLSTTLRRTMSIVRPKSAAGTQDCGAALSESIPHGGPHREDSNSSSDVGGPRFHTTSIRPLQTTQRTAGDAVVYLNTWKTDDNMIRERVSTQGVVRPLEPISELDAFQFPSDTIGKLSEISVRRYLNAQAKFDKKFANTTITIQKHHQRNLKNVRDDAIKNIHAIQHSLLRDGNSSNLTVDGVAKGLMASSGWAWALDGEERPPPSSIVSRRDTKEARALARIADQSILQSDQSLSGNKFWSAAVNFFTATPDRHQHSFVDSTRRKVALSNLFSRTHRSDSG